MSEIEDDSIDLIITSPPFNLGTEYLEFKDRQTHENYLIMLNNVISESYRVLNDDGIFIIEIADTVLTDKYISLSALIQSICLKIGFSLKERHFNFAISRNGIELPDHGWGDDFIARGYSHSNLNQILVFSKKKVVFNPKCKTLYSNYVSTKDHPCPFPKAHISFFLDNYFKKGFNVLDPFMGTADLGAEVLKRKGNYFGYEIVKEFYNLANSKLNNANK